MKKLLLAILFCTFAGQTYALSVPASHDEDYTALHKAAEDCAIDELHAALDPVPSAERGKELDHLDREGYTPLSYAARVGCLEGIKFLIRSGATVRETDFELFYRNQQLEIRVLNQEREKMISEIQRLQDDIRQLNDTINNIRSQIGNDAPRPY